MKKLAVLILACTCLFSCGKKNRYAEIDTSKSTVEPIKIERFDRDFFQMDTTRIDSSLALLKPKYGQFSDLYLKGIIGASPLYPEGKIVHDFLTHPAYRELYGDCETEYKDMSQEEQELTEAFKRLNTLFPNIQVPKVYTIFSGFGNFIVVDEGILAVSLEYYLGKDYKNYKYVDGIYDYLIPNLRRERLTTDAITGWVESEFTLKEETPTLLANIILQGKLLYLNEALFPDKSQLDLMGYSKDQWDWCEANEAQMWGYLTENRHLFSTDQILIAKYTTPAPFTSYFPQDSPGRAGNWIGWQIVRSYMEKNANVTIQQLMENNDAQEILENSGYRPK